MAHKDGTKSGGRVAGTPNKATRELKAFLDDVFTSAFADPGFRAELLLQITTLKLDPTLLRTLLAYWAGQPPKAVEHKHTGKLTLEQLVAGVTPAADVDEDGE
jgi:hypothetical protein